MFIMGGAREAEREGFESPRLAVGGCGVVARGRLRRCCSRRAQLGLTRLIERWLGWCAALGEHPRCNRGFEALAGSCRRNVQQARPVEAEREGFESPRPAVGGCGVVARGRLRRCCSRRAQLGLTELLAGRPSWRAALGEHPRCNRGFEAVAGSCRRNVQQARPEEAEREGFEPSVEEYPQQRFSRPPPSTTRSPLRAVGSLAWCVGRARQRMAITFQGTAVSDLVRSAHGRNHER